MYGNGEHPWSGKVIMNTQEVRNNVTCVLQSLECLPTKYTVVQHNETPTTRHADLECVLLRSKSPILRCPVKRFNPLLRILQNPARPTLPERGLSMRQDLNPVGYVITEVVFVETRCLRRALQWVNTDHCKDCYRL